MLSLFLLTVIHCCLSAVKCLRIHYVVTCLISDVYPENLCRNWSCCSWFYCTSMLNSGDWNYCYFISIGKLQVYCDKTVPSTCIAMNGLCHIHDWIVTTKVINRSGQGYHYIWKLCPSKLWCILHTVRPYLPVEVFVFHTVAATSLAYVFVRLLK